MLDLPHFFESWSDAITAAVAVIALIQPWIGYAWRRFFRPGRIEIYETGSIEVCYSTFGPTIGLTGTLRACHRDFFIRSLRLVVLKKKDRSQHQFDWMVFRSAKITVGKGDEVTAELPFGFMVMALQPHRYNILFNDQSRLDEMKPLLITTIQAWTTHQNNPQFANQSPQSIYSSFSPTSAHVNTYTNLDRLFYWEAGQYTLTLIIEADRSFTKTYSFTLSPEDERNLRLNAVLAIAEVCGQPNIKYNFVYSRYNA